MTFGAAALAVPAYERYDIGRVVSTIIKMIGRNLPNFILFTVVCAFIPGIFSGAVLSKMNSTLPVVGVNSDISTAMANFKSHSLANSGLFLLSSLITLLGLLYLQAGVVGTVVGDLEGTTGVSPWRAAWRHILPLLGITIVVGLAIGFSSILLLVPGILVGLALSVTVPARVAEARGVFSSMQRSRDLTRGCRWRIFLTFLLFFGFGMVLGSASIILRTIFHAPPSLWAITVAPLINAVSTLVGTVGLAVIYCELRTAKEGGGATALAAAFD